MNKLFNGNLNIEYGQFYFDVADNDVDLDDELLPDTAFEGQRNGLCGAAQQGKLFFVTGIQNGVISLDCELHEQEPEVNDEYQEIVEVSLVVGDEPISLCEWAHEETHKLNLSSGNYRVRYLIQGFDKDYDDEERDDDSYWESPLEGQSHRIQIWRGDVEQDRLVKHTTENARYWHEEWGSLKAA